MELPINIQINGIYFNEIPLYSLLKEDNLPHQHQTYIYKLSKFPRTYQPIPKNRHNFRGQDKNFIH